jgi:hypothetical protein
MTLSGQPVFTRCEAAPIAHDWNWGSPGTGIGIDGFSVRWTGRFDFAAGAHRFTARADDGVRLLVDGTQLINGWVDQATTTYTADRTLTAGAHDVRLEYYENTDYAIAELSWASTNSPPVAVASGSPTTGPAPLTVNFDGGGSSDPEGGALTYAWDLDGDGAFDDSTAVAPSQTYTQSVVVRLRVTDAQGLSATSAAIAISVGNTAPTASIVDPALGSTWKVGDTIAFTGSATDPEQGTLPASAFSWQVVLPQCPSSCPETLQTFTGVRSGSFTAPDRGYPSYLELRLTVTDAGGLTDTKILRLDPRTVVLSFASAPTGLQLTVGGTNSVTPFARTVIEGSTNSVSAPTPQTLAATQYQWQSWSDGGAQSHTIVANAPATYTATYGSTGLCSRSSAVWLTGMEHGVVSTAGGGIYSSLAGTPTADNTIARSGVYSLRIADASASATVRALRSVPASNVLVTRFAVRLSSLPSVTSNLAYVNSGTDLVLRYNATSQRFQLVLGASTATSTTATSAATWYVFDVRYDLRGNLHLGDWRVDGVAQTQVSRSASPATANGFGLGATANASVYTANYDDILVATQPTAYPLAASRIVRLSPDSMGTSVGVGNFRNNDGTAIDANSWQRLDEVPMTSTADYVRQQANGGTSYVEFGLQNTSEMCIPEVSVLLAYHAAGSAADTGKTSILDGTTETVGFSGDMSQTALQYKSAIVTPAAGLWHQSAVNGLVARVGYSTDSSPNPFWDSIMVEAAVAG